MMIPLYRLQGNGDHFYTTSESERDKAISDFGYTSEGIACYVSSEASRPYDRDQIAMQILTSIIQGRGAAKPGNVIVDVSTCYLYADAMIAKMK